ncbi:unnamed protein product [Acanthoscelides obtectus]|uniref:BPTI/Kunitz inhibitor domain-containing protein n=1 Tax=Acanthoscelides obtectus TaxID=200917 RepID=A0A9P0LDH7_ACAOB|nr:unnamed protein product [Acanthoscelides obtectus]CAK1660011.1 hypothetical protein AOBTE_LOCUS21811 [Acanthoscelides obtectus]
MKLITLMFALCSAVAVQSRGYPVPYFYGGSRAFEEPFDYDDCFKDVEMGPIRCRAHFLSYKWDMVTMQCQETVYGGCKPTKNNFLTLEDCINTAQDICQRIQEPFE